MNAYTAICPVPDTSDAARDSGLFIDGVTHAYDGAPVVRDVSLGVAPGEFVCLLGPSGCGKTTTLRLAAGLEAAQQGRVMLMGNPVSAPGRHVPPEKRSVGFLFQDYALFPHLTVLGNVVFGIRHLAENDRRARAEEVLETVGMASYMNTYPHQLSGGQQQRVALARALAPDPRLMLLDEPFSGLDARLRDQVRDETLHVLKNSGVATLMVTHDPEEAMFMADRIALMRDGRVEQMGSPFQLYTRPTNAFVATFFGEVNDLEGVVRDSRIETCFGPVETSGLADGTAVRLLIRPEALKLEDAAPADGDEPGTAEVLASRLLGRSSLLHLSVRGLDPHVRLHLHARIPGQVLPCEGERLRMSLDRNQVFVFPVDDPR